jgi:hypothetical protein
MFADTQHRLALRCHGYTTPAVPHNGGTAAIRNVPRQESKIRSLVSEKGRATTLAGL